MTIHWQQSAWELPLIQNAKSLSLGLAGLYAYRLEQHILQASKRDSSLLNDYTVNMMHILFDEDNAKKWEATVASLKMDYGDDKIVCKKLSQRLHATLGGDDANSNWNRGVTIRLRAAAQTIREKTSAFNGQTLPNSAELERWENSVARLPNPIQWLNDKFYKIRNGKRSDNERGLNLLKWNICYHKLAFKNNDCVSGIIRGTDALIVPELLPRLQYPILAA